MEANIPFLDFPAKPEIKFEELLSQISNNVWRNPFLNLCNQNLDRLEIGKFV